MTEKFSFISEKGGVLGLIALFLSNKSVNGVNLYF